MIQSPLATARRPLVLALLACLSITPACKRDESAAPSDAGADASPKEAESAAPAPTVRHDERALPEPGDHSIPAGEAVRKSVAKIDDEPSLARQRDAIVGFFKEDLPSPLAAQLEALPGDRMAILIPGKRELEKPFVMVVDANGTRAWTKEMPLAGIVPGVRDIAIVRGEDSSVGVAFCDSTGKLAALRTWLSDGGINADYEILEIPHCEFVSAAFVPGSGHLIAASGEGTARIGRIEASGMRSWGRGGLTLPWVPAKGAAITIAVDTDNTFVLLGAGTTPEGDAKREGIAILAMRYDMRGKELWPAPISVGRPSGPIPERVSARVVGTGKLEVELEEKPGKRVELSAEGSVIVLPSKR